MRNLESGLIPTSQPTLTLSSEVGDMLDMNTLDTVIPSRQFLTELVERLDCLVRFMGAQGESAGFRDEAVSLAGEMVVRARVVSATVQTCKQQPQGCSLDHLRTCLSGLGLVGILNEFDRSLYEVQASIGDEVNQHEAAMEAADVPGRDVLDKLEAEHFQLHRIMREVVAL
jgi:hypothetical protein